MTDKIKPIEEKNRIVMLDVLRGIAILGIFFVNMPSFFSPVMYLNPAEYWGGGLNRALEVFIDIFFQASFYPMFAFLFGYGAILMADRLKEKGLSFPPFFARRLFVLLIFGVLHAFFVWHGDILITYALCGVIFLLFYKRNANALFMIGLPVYIMINGLLCLGSLLLNQQEVVATLYDSESVRLSLEAYQNGTYGELFNQRYKDWYSVNGPSGFWLQAFTIVPLIFAGAAFAKKKWLENVSDSRRLLTFLMLFSLLGGLFLKLGPYLPIFEDYPYTSMIVQDQFGGPLMALFYITSIVLMGESKTIRNMLLPASYVGRLSISNYLFQSIFSTSLFYSYGLGLYGEISYKAGFGLVIVIYLFQVVLSKWWLEKYRFGPVEYIWRWGTYGKKPVFRRGEKVYEISNSGK